MKKMLMVIDVQNDFINDNTRKYVKEIDKLINSNQYDDVLFTKFVNSKNSIWYNKLNYMGCLSSPGKDIVINTKNYKVFEKSVYSALNNEIKTYIKNNNIDEIYLCGFDTDACILKTALDLFENGYNVYVLQNCCMSTKGVENHNFTITNLKRLIGKETII